MNRPLGRAELIAWVRLARAPRVGAVTFGRLLARHSTPIAAMEGLARFAPEAAAAAPSVDEIEAELQALEAMGARLVARMEPAYPAQLAALAAPPPLLAMRGNMAMGQRPAIALVGSRDASAAGMQMAEQLARDLGESGFVIVSGLARGIDTAAHHASLAHGTIAVLAGGLDKPYPPLNLGLHDSIVEQGLVIAESKLGLSARAQDFPRRNLIIAGLVQAVIVVEAEARSGALITARAALDFGREVMAVPGSPLDRRARGPNGLIKDGAALVETADDVLAALGAPRQLSSGTPAASIDEDLQLTVSADVTAQVKQLLSPTPMHLNEIARQAGTSTAAVAAALVELEMMGAATSLGGGYASSGGGGS